MLPGSLAGVQGPETGNLQQAGAQHVNEQAMGESEPGSNCLSLHTSLSPKMNLLFNPSYLKVSAGRQGARQTWLTPLLLTVPGGALGPLALHCSQLPSPHRLRGPTLGKAHMHGCSSRTPSDLHNLCFGQDFSARGSPPPQLVCIRERGV